MFNEFYAVYPKKVDKQLAEKRFNALEPGTQRIVIADVLDRKSHHAQWQDKNFVPSPARYLLREMWNDEIIREKSKEEKQLAQEDSQHPVHSRLWTMLQQMYGAQVVNGFGGTIPKAWVYGLPGLTEKECGKILRYLATDTSEFAPNLPKINRIRKIGRDLPVYNQLQIGNPAKTETVNNALSEMRESLK
jgi:hypothetical protein